MQTLVSAREDRATKSQLQRGFLCALGVIAYTTSVWGSPPLQPLSPPLYSFDDQSPQVLDGTLSPDAVLQLGDPTPVVAIPGNALGLGQPGDQIDALSSNQAGFPPTATFSLLFSIDRASVGAAAPDPLLVSSGVPFSASDQAAKNHGAGDQYISLDTFQLGGLAVGVPVLGSGSNNSQVRNNFDEGGVDFAAKPETSSSTVLSAFRGGVAAMAAPQDNVVATLGTGLPANIAGGDSAVYFSLCLDPRGTCASPSIANLSGGVAPSGASLFYHPDPGSPMGGPSLFAGFAALGLQQGDDINAMVVLDVDANGIFDGDDRVFYSLAPDSPSLELFPEASATGASADVFSVSPSGARTLVAPAAALGLGAVTDNIDALDILPCADGLACALAHGMRAGDIPAVSEWGLAILALVVMAAGGVVLRRSHRAWPVR